MCIKIREKEIEAVRKESFQESVKRRSMQRCKLIRAKDSIIFHTYTEIT